MLGTSIVFIIAWFCCIAALLIISLVLGFLGLTISRAVDLVTQLLNILVKNSNEGF